MKRSSGKKRSDRRLVAGGKKGAIGRGTRAVPVPVPDRTAREPARERASAKAKDEARTLSLLWRAEDRSGRSGLTVTAIVRAAVKLAGEEGVEAVSMRRLAELLEVGTMSLYTHVPGKAELTELMVDAVQAELYRDVDEAQSQPGGYRERLYFIAERHRAMYARHPWLLDLLPFGRPVLGPSAVKKYETELRVLDGIGLTPLEMDSIVALLTLHVQSSSRLRATDRRAQQADGMTEVDWWVHNVSLLQRVMTGHYPTATRIGRAAGEAMAPGPSAEHLYRFGLDVICDAVAAMIARKRSE